MRQTRVRKAAAPALAAALGLGLALGLGACTGRSGSETIQVKGSDTMVNLGGRWADAFRKKRSDIAVAVTGGGSGTGIAAFLNGSCTIAECSRAMKEKERKLAEAAGRKVKEIQVASDGVVVVIHPANPVTELTIEQLSQIFQRKLTSWKQVGGPDVPIDVLSRARNSGTHVYFLEHVVRMGNKHGKQEYAPDVAMMPSSQAVYDEVARNERAIGYYGLGYLGAKNKAVAVSANGKPAVVPSMETASDGSYPISRPLFFYTDGEPQGAVKAYVDFVLSDDGQRIVLAEGFVPLRPVSLN